MEKREVLLKALEQVAATINELGTPERSQGERLNEQLPLGGETMQRIRAMVLKGIQEGWLADRGEPGLKWGRLTGPTPELHNLSVDVVVRSQPGPGHTHPNGEFDLCFATSGDPRFDGNAEGWVVYGEGSYHVPTVTGGEMAIVYLLPGGAIDFKRRG